MVYARPLSSVAKADDRRPVIGRIARLLDGIAVRHHALCVGDVIAVLQRGSRGVGVVCSGGAAEGQSAGAADRRPGADIAGRGSDRGPGGGPQGGAEHGGADGVLVGRLGLVAVADLGGGVVAAACVLCLEAREILALFRQGHDARAGRRGDTGRQRQGGDDTADAQGTDHSRMSFVGRDRPDRRPVARTMISARVGVPTSPGAGRSRMQCQ